MPLFDLVCVPCGREWETLAKNRDDLDEECCPDCSSEDVVLKLTSHGFYRIKGPNGSSVTPKKFRGGKAE